jgi:hypothetical protein
VGIIRCCRKARHVEYSMWQTLRGSQVYGGRIISWQCNESHSTFFYDLSACRRTGRCFGIVVGVVPKRSRRQDRRINAHKYLSYSMTQNVLGQRRGRGKGAGGTPSINGGACNKDLVFLALRVSKYIFSFFHK